jgi:hypothetical protein
MLQRVVNIINSSSSRNIGNGTLYCNNVTVTDNECIAFIEENNILENTISQQNPVNLELTLARLNSIGYYEDTTVFILKNKYSIPNTIYYIEELRCYSTDCNEFIDKYSDVISLINSIKNIARHTYTDIDILNSLIFREDKALLLPFIYDAISIQQITTSDIFKIKEITPIFSEEENSDKKQLFINELIEFLVPQSENERFVFFLSHIVEFVDRANNAYQYYIRNFSYNKLKTELDNAALEYSKKIQSVINDAQSKLVVIPAAFVLGVSSMDFPKILNTKNIIIICSLFIFALLIELFVRNQKSALKFIQKNIDDYKQTYKSMKANIIRESFCLVDNEWKNQDRRVSIIRWITWGIPVTVTIIFTICLLIQKPIIINTIIKLYKLICQQ